MFSEESSREFRKMDKWSSGLAQGASKMSKDMTGNGRRATAFD